MYSSYVASSKFSVLQHLTQLVTFDNFKTHSHTRTIVIVSEGTADMLQKSKTKASTGMITMMRQLASVVENKTESDVGHKC